MPGFEDQARAVAKAIEKFSRKSGKLFTPVDIKLPTFGKRSSGEPFLQFDKQHVGGHDCIIIGSGPGTWEMLGMLNLLLRYTAGRRARRIALSLGYFPLSRSDKDEGELEFSLPQYFIEQMIQSATTTRKHLDRIITVDMHAPQMVMAGPTGLITELTLIRLVLKRAIEDARAGGESVCLAFPDDGSAKRTGRAIDALERELGIHIPIVCGIKRRASSTEAEIKQLFGATEALRGATVLCVDDEIATGGTNIKSARIIRSEYGASRVHAVVTHGILCGEAPARFQVPDCPVDRIYATDTVLVNSRADLQPLIESNRLVVIPWSQEIGVSLYHHHWDLSIRELR